MLIRYIIAKRQRYVKALALFISKHIFSHMGQYPGH